MTILGVAMAGLLVVGCGEKKDEKKAEANATAAAPKTLVLGVAGAHSGDLASYGMPTLNAAKLVAKELNAKGGVNGMQVEVMPMDDQCKPELATNAATKLVSEKVSIVLGHICSGATKAALPIYKDAKVVVMTPSATSTELTQSGNYPNFFRTISYDLIQGKAAAEFAVSELKVKKVAVIHDKGDYGKGLPRAPRRPLRTASPPRSSCSKASPPAAWTIPPSCRRSSPPAPTACSSAATIPKPARS
jgi:ABC-type branched-chain amino acid transport systems, periplasmic component